MKNLKEIMTIASTENNHAKINMLEKLCSTRATTSPNILNDIISGKNDQWGGHKYYIYIYIIGTNELKHWTYTK